MAKDYYLYEKDPVKRVATITFNRPEKLNAMEEEDSPKLLVLLRQIEEDDDVRVVVFKGAGSCFGAGQDISVVGPATGGFSRDPNAARPTLRKRLLSTKKWTRPDYAGSALHEFTKVSVCQVHGYCYGIQFYIATQADIVIASEDALFGHPGFRWVGPELLILEWVDCMGLKKAKEMVFSGRPFTAQEMKECGFVNKVVPKENLEKEVQELVSAIALQPTDLLMFGKQLFEVISAMRGEVTGKRLMALAGTLATYFKSDPGDYVVLRDLAKMGATGGVAGLSDAPYPPSYRYSLLGRAGKKKYAKR